MAQHDFLFNHHIVAGLYPVADCFAGGKSTDIISMAAYRRCTFIVLTGAIEDAGVSNLLTVEACSTAAAGATTAIPFRYRTCPSSSTVDVWTALAAAPATGYNAEAAFPAANLMTLVEVTSAEMEAAAPGYPFVRLTIAETANKTITAAVIAILSEPRTMGIAPVQAIA